MSPPGTVAPATESEFTWTTDILAEASIPVTVFSPRRGRPSWSASFRSTMVLAQPVSSRKWPGRSR